MNNNFQLQAFAQRIIESRYCDDYLPVYKQYVWWVAKKDLGQAALNRFDTITGVYDTVIVEVNGNLYEAAVHTDNNSQFVFITILGQGVSV